MALLKYIVLFFALFKYKADDFIAFQIYCSSKNKIGSEGYIRQYFVLC